MEEGSGRQRCLKMMFLYQDADQLYDKQTKARIAGNGNSVRRPLYVSWAVYARRMHLYICSDAQNACIHSHPGPLAGRRGRKRHGWRKTSCHDAALLPARTSFRPVKKKKKTPPPIGGPFPQELPNATPLHA